MVRSKPVEERGRRGRKGQGRRGSRAAAARSGSLQTVAETAIGASHTSAGDVQGGWGRPQGQIPLTQIGRSGGRDLDARLLRAIQAALLGEAIVRCDERICGFGFRKGYYGDKSFSLLTVISPFRLPHDLRTYTHAAMTARPPIYALRSSPRATIGRGTRSHMDALTNIDRDGSDVVTTVFLSNLHCSRCAPDSPSIPPSALSPTR